VIEQVLKIGDDVVDPQHIVPGNIRPVSITSRTPILDGHHILADFQPTERDNFNLLSP
jgi:hypothetical protein